MKRNYYIAEASWADKLVKNRAHPQWVHILNKEYLQTMLKYNGSTSFVDRIFHKHNSAFIIYLIVVNSKERWTTKVNKIIWMSGQHFEEYLE